MADERTGQDSGQGADLAAAVELVAAEVEQHDHLRVHGLGDRRNVQLVDLSVALPCFLLPAGHARKISPYINLVNPGGRSGLQS